MSDTHNVQAVGSTDQALFVNEYGATDVAVSVTLDGDSAGQALHVSVVINTDTLPVAVTLEGFSDPMPLYSGYPEHDESPAQTLDTIRGIVQSNPRGEFGDAGAIEQIEHLLSRLGTQG